MFDDVLENNFSKPNRKSEIWRPAIREYPDYEKRKTWLYDFPLIIQYLLRSSIFGLKTIKGDVAINGCVINNIRCADDTVLLTWSQWELQRLIDAVVLAGKSWGLFLNVEPTLE